MRAILTEPVSIPNDHATQQNAGNLPQSEPEARLPYPHGNPEFTCLCPKTGQPDFATLILDYIADQQCVELKSLKLYMWSFREEGHFHEDVTNRILDDLVAATNPRFMRLTAKFYVRAASSPTSLPSTARKAGSQRRSLN